MYFNYICLVYVHVECAETPLLKWCNSIITSVKNNYLQLKSEVGGRQYLKANKQE